MEFNWQLAGFKCIFSVSLFAQAQSHPQLLNTTNNVYEVTRYLTWIVHRGIVLEGSDFDYWLWPTQTPNYVGWEAQSTSWPNVSIRMWCIKNQGQPVAAGAQVNIEVAPGYIQIVDPAAFDVNHPNIGHVCR